MTIWELGQALAFWVILGLLTRGALSRRQPTAEERPQRPPAPGLLPSPRDGQEAADRQV